MHSTHTVHTPSHPSILFFSQTPKSDYIPAPKTHYRPPSSLSAFFFQPFLLLLLSLFLFPLSLHWQVHPDPAGRQPHALGLVHVGSRVVALEQGGVASLRARVLRVLRRLGEENRYRGLVVDAVAVAIIGGGNGRAVFSVGNDGTQTSLQRRAGRERPAGQFAEEGAVEAAEAGGRSGCGCCGCC